MVVSTRVGALIKSERMLAKRTLVSHGVLKVVNGSVSVAVTQPNKKQVNRQVLHGFLEVKSYFFSL